MRHFIGGFMVGFIFILCKPGKLPKTMFDFWTLFVAAAFIGLCTGTLVWGLYP